MIDIIKSTPIPTSCDASPKEVIKVDAAKLSLASVIEKRAHVAIEALLLNGYTERQRRIKFGNMAVNNFRIELDEKMLKLTYEINGDVASLSCEYHLIETYAEFEMFVEELTKLLQTEPIKCSSDNGPWIYPTTLAWTGFTWA